MYGCALFDLGEMDSTKEETRVLSARLDRDFTDGEALVKEFK